MKHNYDRAATAFLLFVAAAMLWAIFLGYFVRLAAS